ncbi:MAG: hypothetical protein ACRD3W_03200 [Terriglobales bacterium]
MIKRLTSTAILLTLVAWLGVFCAARAADAPTGPTLQAFVCDDDGCSTGTAQFVGSLGHLVLNLSIAEKSDVEVGAVVKNVNGLPAGEVQVDYRGQVNADFGPHLIFTYVLPNSKVAGRVVPFVQGAPIAGAPEGYTRLSFKGIDMGMVPGTTLRSLEILGIGENGGGSTTIDTVTVNGVTAAKAMSTQNTCDYVP